MQRRNQSRSYTYVKCIKADRLDRSSVDFRIRLYVIHSYYEDKFIFHLSIFHLGKGAVTVIVLYSCSGAACIAPPACGTTSTAGCAAGCAAGFAAGFAAGYAAGCAAGFAAGCAAGAFDTAGVLIKGLVKNLRFAAGPAACGSSVPLAASDGIKFCPCFAVVACA